jgi:signal transduction histidine kinase
VSAVTAMRMSRLRSTVILFLVMAVGAVARPAAGEESKAILLLHSYGYDTPARLPFDAAFARAVREAADVHAELYIETIDPNRFKGDLHAQRTRAYLRERYSDKKIAVIVAAYDRALAFLLDGADPLFPGVPVAALLTGDPHSQPDHVSVIWSGDTIGESAALAVKLHPRTRQIALVDGALPGAANDAVYSEALKQIEGAAPHLAVISLRNLPLDELLARVQTLPPDTLIFVVRQLIGRRGETTNNQAAVRELAQVARVPIYVGSDQLIGSGVVGGIVVSIESEARHLANLALRIARDGSLQSPAAEGAPVPMFDWRQLRRWAISESALPSGSVVLFRQPRLWDQYKFYIMGASIALAVQSGLIAILVVQRTRRRRTELALRESEQHLRRSYEQNQDLAGRLLKAQEEERTRIARDLHDDVSQQLAGVAIMLSGLRRLVGKPGARSDIDRTVTTLQDRTSSLAHSIRNLSHELHPSVLQHAGLVATLQRHCADVEQLHHVPVIFSARDCLDSLSPDVALCLFRVAQEAITNAVRHARARNIRVELVATNEGVELRVVDDGIGFLASEHAGRGLGLRSIDERVRLAHGYVTVESRPGRGTNLVVRIPVVGAQAALA